MLIFLSELKGNSSTNSYSLSASNHLEIDESLLTGESNPIHKKENDEILSGSFCLSGNGFYKAVKIGDESYAAQVTKTAKKYKFDLTPLQKRINFIVKALFAVAVVLVILEIIINDGGFDPDFVRKISTILISLVPQGLVLMATVTFAIGVYRISKLGAIVQKLNAIESFSNVKIVCTDKTGTLTQNKLSVHKISKFENSYSEDEIKKLTGTYAKLTFKEESKKIFEENMLSVYRNVLFGKIDTDKTIDEIKDSLDKINIEPLCIISIKDLIREDVFEAIKLFNDNDIHIKILSGDSSKSIQEVAREIGWSIKDSDMISGEELEKVGDEELAKVVLDHTIFSRLKPEHKLRIIKALKKEKIYTAMIGDGVNDLPAIKESDLGIAMEEGSGITKEVADIVLLKNKFSLLPQIFDEGNKIVNSVKSIGKLFITKNFFVIYITLVSLIFLLDFPLTPRRVSLINIFGIGLPAFMITLKNMNVSKTKDFMKDLFSFVIISALIIVFAGYVGIYIIQKFYIVSEKDIQMVMLTIMIITNIANYFSIALTKKESGSNKLIYVIYGFVILLLYIFFAATIIDTGIIHLIKKFYEIDYVRPELWPVIMIISLISSFVLFAAQKVRATLVKS